MGDIITDIYEKIRKTVQHNYFALLGYSIDSVIDFELAHTLIDNDKVISEYILFMEVIYCRDM